MFGPGKLGVPGNRRYCSRCADALPVPGLGHRVVSALAKRLAAHDAPDTQPASTPGTVPLDGLAGVLRATGCEAALLPEKRAQGYLVQADQRYQKFLSHENGPCLVDRRPKKLAVASKFGYNTPSSSAYERAYFQK
jgi:hypothetical protein